MTSLFKVTGRNGAHPTQVNPMNAAENREQIAMRPSGVRVPRIHRELTLMRRRDDQAPVSANWSCGCEYFRKHRFCAHTLHMEQAARTG